MRDGAACYELSPWMDTARTTDLQGRNRRTYISTSLSSSFLICWYLSLSKPNQKPEGSLGHKEGKEGQTQTCCDKRNSDTAQV